MITDAGKRPSLAPRNWGGWMLVGVLWLLGKTPVRLGLWLSRPIGFFLRHLVARRRAVAQRNIERCFPDRSPGEVEALVRENFRALARSLFETAWCWSMSRRRFQKHTRVIGREHLLDAEESGRGVLLVTAHITCLEVGARLACEAAPVVGVYRPFNNPVFEWYQLTRRFRYAQGMISKRDIRSAIRHIRQGGIVWYAPDQDFGPSQSIFVPFFGIPTATLEATHKLVALTDCSVVLMFPRFDAEEGRYVLRIQPPLEDFPSGDAEADLTRLNAEMEAHVRQAPEQYWWIHRRFKTRPPGEAPFYD
ncbi:MAG: LpxL/LpxP family Kdo(2)-lipid IV(A) lauroyl/palmitoleoyl acyltransferase [Xanthomonadales bacterium]|nr:LpxL/LpxP family Kdo(2)-lipid IV(A) lauroyl/palmitoleoyl acyltransferase [Xanthomonadales bacterium]